MLVVDRRKGDLVPALADREAAIVEIAAGPGLGEADQRDGLGGSAAAVGDQRDESVDRGAGRIERLCDRLGRGPAWAALRGDALGFVESGGVEPRLLGQA